MFVHLVAGRLGGEIDLWDTTKSKAWKFGSVPYGV